MPILIRFALLYLLAVVFFTWGVLAARFEVFPWPLLSGTVGEVVAFVRGDADEQVSLLDKIKNDLDIKPGRLVRDYAPRDASHLRTLALPGVRERRDAARTHVAPGTAPMYRVIVGAFDFTKAFWGAVLLSPRGDVMHTWQLSGEYPQVTDKPDILKNLYGIAFLDDGAAIFTMQEAGGAIFRVDRCSQLQWQRPGNFHHTIALDDGGRSFWALQGQQGDLHPRLTKFSTATGEPSLSIDVAEVERRNAHVYIFDLQRDKRQEDATHANDIEVLTPARAGAFPQFAVGSLLLSYRTTNLLYVLDPNTKQIDWWYVGAGDGQHDPDWQADGTISLFANNFRAYDRGVAGGSTIVAVDPRRNTHRVLLDGEDYGFFSRFNGHHHITPHNTVIVTSSTQGRVFEVDLETGQVVFEFINSYQWGSDTTLHLSESFLVTEQQALQWSQQCD